MARRRDFAAIHSNAESNITPRSTPSQFRDRSAQAESHVQVAPGEPGSASMWVITWVASTEVT